MDPERPDQEKPRAATDDEADDNTEAPDAVADSDTVSDSDAVTPETRPVARYDEAFYDEATYAGDDPASDAATDTGASPGDPDGAAPLGTTRRTLPKTGGEGVDVLVPALALAALLVRRAAQRTSSPPR